MIKPDETGSTLILDIQLDKKKFCIKLGLIDVPKFEGGGLSFVLLSLITSWETWLKL